MRQAMKLCALLVLGSIACGSLHETRAAALGSISGFIKDGQGNPLVGAAVVVLAASEDSEAEKIIKRASTNDEGKFIAAGIVPGRYRLKAEAAGFKPVELAALVKPNKATVFDSILLRRVGTLAEETSLNVDSKSAARAAHATIFQHNESGKDPVKTSSDTTVALTEPAPDLHGQAHAFSQSTADTSFVGANFAVSQSLAREAELVVSGQVGYGEGAPQKLEAMTTANAGDRHRVSVALGYGRFTFSRRSATPKLGQFSLSATDTWQVSGPVLIVYGLEFARFTEGSAGTSVLPRFGIAIDAKAHTRLFAGLLPGSSEDVQSRFNLESGEIVFSEPKPVALTEANEPVMDRSYRLQFGSEQILSDKSSVEMMAFFDTVSGHGVGLLAVPVDSAGSEPELRAHQQRGHTRGVRLVYHRRINDVIDGSVGYAFGEGQRLDSQGMTEPANLFTNARFHLFSAKIDANFVGTGTKISTVLRLAPEQAVFAIDPFQGQIATYDPNLSLSLTQELPNLSFMPGQWEAVVSLRNLLDQQSSVSDERQELIASRFHRLIRVGVSLRF